MILICVLWGSNFVCVCVHVLVPGRGLLSLLGQRSLSGEADVRKLTLEESGALAREEGSRQKQWCEQSQGGMKEQCDL